MMKCETLIRPAIDFKTMWLTMFTVSAKGQNLNLNSGYIWCVYVFFFCGLELHVAQKPSTQLTHSHMMGPNQQAV